MDSFSVIKAFNIIKYVSPSLISSAIIFRRTRSRFNNEKKLSAAAYRNNSLVHSCCTLPHSFQANGDSRHWYVERHDLSDGLTLLWAGVAPEPSLMHGQQGVG